MSSSRKPKGALPLVAVGIDIVDVGRFARLDQKRNARFLTRVFTPAERRYCFGRTNTAQHLAARFAAKEAIMKALHGVGVHRSTYRDIEVSHDAHQAPVARLVRQWRCTVSLSISHTNDVAVVTALIHRRG